MKVSEQITLAHGNGGRLMHELIGRLRKKFANKILDQMTDAAELRVKGRRIAFSTDSYVVQPIFFPGGDIGKLAVFGTVNDLAMKGARPLFISLAFIIEEGLEISVLEKIADSIARAARRAGVSIVTGDIKVVEKGAADKIFINTSGIGEVIYPGVITAKAKAGDSVILSGAIAEHGLAIFEAREKMGFISKLKSDCTNVNGAVARALRSSKNIHVLRDPTRGGLATTLNEIAHSSKLGIEVWEKEIPIKPAVKKMCDVLGFDPLYLANEGKFICFIAQRDAARVRKAIGPSARVIGEVVPSPKGQVYLQTFLGSRRILPMLERDQLPRIC